MSSRRKEQVSAKRSRTQQEDDALELHEKGYSYKAIGDLQGISGPTAKDRVQSAKIRSLESEQRQSKIIPFDKRKIAEG